MLVFEGGESKTAMFGVNTRVLGDTLGGGPKARLPLAGVAEIGLGGTLGGGPRALNERVWVRGCSRLGGSPTSEVDTDGDAKVTVTDFVGNEGDFSSSGICNGG